jgi:hypothetical protein
MLGVIPVFIWGREKNVENLSHNRQSPDRDLNPGPNEYKTLVPLNRPQSLIQKNIKKFKKKKKRILVYAVLI